MCSETSHRPSLHIAMLRIMREFPSLDCATQYALAKYDADVADGSITFAANGHRDTAVHPEVWLAGRPVR